MPKLSRNYLKEGYMEKTGPKVGLTGRPGPSQASSDISISATWGWVGLGGP